MYQIVNATDHRQGNSIQNKWRTELYCLSVNLLGVKDRFPEHPIHLTLLVDYGVGMSGG